MSFSTLNTIHLTLIKFIMQSVPNRFSASRYAICWAYRIKLMSSYLALGIFWHQLFLNRTQGMPDVVFDTGDVQGIQVEMVGSPCSDRPPTRGSTIRRRVKTQMIAHRVTAPASVPRRGCSRDAPEARIPRC